MKLVQKNGNGLNRGISQELNRCSSSPLPFGCLTKNKQSIFSFYKSKGQVFSLASFSVGKRHLSTAFLALFGILHYVRNNCNHLLLFYKNHFVATSKITFLDLASLAMRNLWSYEKQVCNLQKKSVRVISSSVDSIPYLD